MSLLISLLVLPKFHHDTYCSRSAANFCFLCKSVVEIYIAIVVSCMPAFAKFARTHIVGSRFLKYLASPLKGRKSGGAPAEWPFDSLEQSKSTRRSLRTTFGGTKPPRALVAIRRQPGLENLDAELNDTITTWAGAADRTSSQVNVTASDHVADLELGLTRICEIQQSNTPLFK